MARSDLLLDLVRSGAEGDSATFRRVVQTLAADERAKRHDLLADRLESLLEQPAVDAVPLRNLNSPMAVEGVRESWPTSILNDLVLSEGVRASLDDFVEQQLRSDELRTHGLEPAGKLLLVGPPGCGKTSIAQAISNALTLPLYTVRYEALFSSYLGETLARLARLFDLARRDRCVLFFDELDTVAKERSDGQELGEIKRLVSSLLLFLDEAPTYSPVIAATNHPDLMDKAAWRRFSVRLRIEAPSLSSLEMFFTNWRQRHGVDLGLASSTLAKAVVGSSYAEALDLAEAIARRVVLAGTSASPRTIAQAEVKRFQAAARAR